MSRIAKWKLEKTKVKVVFRLQFHATHVSQLISSADTLHIYFSFLSVFFLASRCLVFENMAPVHYCFHVMTATKTEHISRVDKIYKI